LVKDKIKREEQKAIECPRRKQQKAKKQRGKGGGTRLKRPILGHNYKRIENTNKRTENQGSLAWGKLQGAGMFEDKTTKPRVDSNMKKGKAKLEK